MLICKHMYINSCHPRPTNGLERQQLLLLLNEGKLAEKQEFEGKKKKSAELVTCREFSCEMVKKTVLSTLASRAIGKEASSVMDASVAATCWGRMFPRTWMWPPLQPDCALSPALGITFRAVAGVASGSQGWWSLQAQVAACLPCSAEALLSPPAGLHRVPFLATGHLAQGS